MLSTTTVIGDKNIDKLKLIPGSIIVCKTIGNIILWHNDQFSIITGIAKKNHEGENFKDFFSKETIKEIEKQDLEVIQTRQTISKKIIIKTLSGFEDYYIVFQAPCINHTQEEVTNTIVSLINLQDYLNRYFLFRHSQRSNIKFLHQNSNYVKQEKETELYIQCLLKEALFLNNLFLNKHLDLESQTLYKELRQILKNLLNVFEVKELSRKSSKSNFDLSFFEFEKINLKKFIQNIINESFKVFKNLCVVNFHLKISKNIPKTCGIEISNIKNIIQTIINLFLAALSKESKAKLFCIIDSIDNYDDSQEKIRIVFYGNKVDLTGIDENYLKKFFLAKELIISLDGNIEIINFNNNNNFKIILYFPVGRFL